MTKFAHLKFVDIHFPCACGQGCTSGRICMNLKPFEQHTNCGHCCHGYLREPDESQKNPGKYAYLLDLVIFTSEKDLKGSGKFKLLRAKNLYDYGILTQEFARDMLNPINKNMRFYFGTNISTDKNFVVEVQGPFIYDLIINKKFQNNLFLQIFRNYLIRASKGKCSGSYAKPPKPITISFKTKTKKNLQKKLRYLLEMSEKIDDDNFPYSLYDFYEDCHNEKICMKFNHNDF